MHLMIRLSLCGTLLGALVTFAAAPPARLPWQRLLTGEDARGALQMEKQIQELLHATRWTEAKKVLEELIALRSQKQGKDHWEVVRNRHQLSAIVKVLMASSEKQQAFAESIRLHVRIVELEGKKEYGAALPLQRKVLAIWSDVLGPEHPHTASRINDVALNQHALGNLTQAEENLRKALAIRRKVLGEEHPDLAASHNNIASCLEAQGKVALAEEHFRLALTRYLEVLGPEHPTVAGIYTNLAENQLAQRKYAFAEGCCHKALAIRRKALGEDHPETATSHHNLAYARSLQGKYSLAEEGYIKALDIQRKVLGEVHLETAGSYKALAECQEMQRKADLAEDNYRKTLIIRRKLLGEEHLDTVLSYAFLAMIQHEQGKFALAEENFTRALPGFRKVLGEEHDKTAIILERLALAQQAQGKYALAEPGLRQVLSIRRKLFGDDNAKTATGFNNLAANYSGQGKYALAEEAFRKVLEIQNQIVRGQEHPDIARTYNNLGTTLTAQKKYDLAEECYLKALAMYRKLLGEEHRDTASSYGILAGHYSARDEYALSEKTHEKALAIRRKVLPENHPLLAKSYHNLAVSQNEQGKLAVAEENMRKALDIRRRILGESHPDTVNNYVSLAVVLKKQGNKEAAEALVRKASELFSVTRLQVATTGLDRSSFTGEWSPLPWHATLLARDGKGRQAWEKFEQSLGQGSGDDFSTRLQRSPADQQRLTSLLIQLQGLESRLLQLDQKKEAKAETRMEREKLLDDQLRAQNALAALHKELHEKYKLITGQVFPVAVLQKALPVDGAFLGWVDVEGDSRLPDSNPLHWAVLLKGEGEPIWVPLAGSGPGKSWTAEDTELPGRLLQALLNMGNWQPLARKLYAQRLAPLERHLVGVRQLVLLPSEQMDAIPLEVLTDKFTTSYTPSASLFAQQKRQAAAKAAGLLALGDPDFKYPDQVELPLPPGGVLLSNVPPGSPAALGGLRSGDVLLHYGETKVNSLDDLQKAISRADKIARVKVWRIEAGAKKATALSLTIPAGKLGVTVATQAAPKALIDQRRGDRILAARDQENWQRLPGTLYEVNALVRLFPEPKPTVLLGSDASESKLAELVKDGKLKQARYIHLATHGQDRRDRLLASRIILARDRLKEGQSGDISAEKVLLEWDLQAELVTLSACQSGLGKYERGEGFVGFAQALLLAGARTVCLSRWSVNDLSTALLMERFYQNLLGKREGLKAPMSKALALAEAKQWLRTLPRAEALKRAEAIGAGVERAPGAKPLPAVKVPDGAKEQPPYAHPYFWAGFVLVGNRE